MALIKEVIGEDGIPTKYHRIALVTIDVNNQCTILVHSYLNAAARQVELDYRAGVTDVLNPPYVNAVYYTRDYDPDLSVNAAYRWLKTLPEFEGAVDDL